MHSEPAGRGFGIKFNLVKLHFIKLLEAAMLSYIEGFMCAGRMFEGTAATMLSSLDVICELPDDTLVWPGKSS